MAEEGDVLAHPGERLDQRGVEAIEHGGDELAGQAQAPIQRVNDDTREGEGLAVQPGDAVAAMAGGAVAGGGDPVACGGVDDGATDDDNAGEDGVAGELPEERREGGISDFGFRISD
ncbi:MAG: hypothetical protein PHU85_07575 [Phycisphaerae bacterium]|nr:hypothetical protein [Phycisphaerae bacterium]